MLACSNLDSKPTGIKLEDVHPGNTSDHVLATMTDPELDILEFVHLADRRLEYIYQAAGSTWRAACNCRINLDDGTLPASTSLCVPKLFVDNFQVQLVHHIPLQGRPSALYLSRTSTSCLSVVSAPI